MQDIEKVIVAHGRNVGKEVGNDNHDYRFITGNAYEKTSRYYWNGNPDLNW